jgi:hypothetical protein
MNNFLSEQIDENSSQPVEDHRDNPDGVGADAKYFYPEMQDEHEKRGSRLVVRW